MSGVLDLDPWAWAEEEPSGDSDKQWLRGGSLQQHWLFKPLKPHRSQDEAASEYVASRVASLLEVPSAHVELGRRNGVLGCVSANVITEPTHSLVDGAMYISALVENFDPKDRHSVGHRPDTIAHVVEHLDAPVGFDGTALAAFTGYLVLDALIGNTDRHSRNWAVEARLEGRDLLAKSFDHATSLGVSLRGPKRDQLLLETNGVREFASRATAHRFEGGRNVSLVRFATEFLRDYSPETRQDWHDRLSALRMADVDADIEDSLMSEPGSKLARNIVRINRERIVECLKQD